MHSVIAQLHTLKPKLYLSVPRLPGHNPASGPLVLWSSGPLVLWSSGPLIFWSSSPLVLWSSDLLVL
ncbi:hypothetical protein EYF80_065837 [Liparis tanakae]|uniref:Uncharacterized protein n=1 Tax=Liparis tanakae TaxID=230148 RepID=A0A4Z2E619_9TELE|nr:hypothetical protein EYF80_065837 [Liparis tanakae]